MKLPAVIQGDLEEARKALARGNSLERAAYMIGLTAQELDLMLWQQGGALRHGALRIWRSAPLAWLPAPVIRAGGQL